MILYPDIKTYSNHRLEVESPHVLYVQECGNKDGIPVLFVHGGPGAGCESYHKRFFDPKKYRIILYDQRGSGRSTPHAELEGNNTQALLDDIESIRKHLKVEQWVMFGGSWGSTLSLLYAQAYPDRVLALILRGVFLCRSEDIDWFYKAGAHRLFPDAWQDFIKIIPEDERGDLIGSYYKRLTGDNDLVRMAAAKAWSLWEGTCATLRPSVNVLDKFTDPHTALSLARIEAHFFMNKVFIKENQILDDMEKIKHIPGIIVHGRYDVICPLENAYTLQAAWPESVLDIVRDAGHSASEPGMVDVLVRATDNMADRFSEQFLV